MVNIEFRNDNNNLNIEEIAHLQSFLSKKLWKFYASAGQVDGGKGRGQILHEIFSKNEAYPIY